MKRVVMIIVCGALAPCASRVEAQLFNELVVFGDSMSDTGNWYVDRTPPPHRVGGRYSNGPVWVEELAAQLDLPTPLPSQDGGTNYAWGGSPTGWGFDYSEGFGIPTIGWQIDQFGLQREPNPNRLIVVHGGGNDLARLFEQDPSTPASNLAQHISDIASMGERYFVVPSLIPLGYDPGFLGTPMEEPLNAVIAEFNRLLAIELDSLEDQLGISVYRADQHSLGLEAIQNPSSFGLTNVTDPAWNGGNVVPNPDEYLFWDEFHYTTAFHRFLGQQAALAVPLGCDFNATSSCDSDDLDLMFAAGPIANGVSVTIGVNDQFDINSDGLIDLADRDAWLADAATENGLGSPYKLGDANIDGAVDGQDFILWNGSKFSDSLLWSEGNFNGDGFVDGQDFIAWNGNKFTSSDVVSAVPEPATGMLCLLGLGFLGFIRRR